MNANKTLLPTTIFLISSTLSPQLTPFCLLALIFSSFIQNSAHRTSHARNVNDAVEQMREREDFVVDDGESRAIGRGGEGGFITVRHFFRPGPSLFSGRPPRTAFLRPGLHLGSPGERSSSLRFRGRPLGKDDPERRERSMPGTGMRGRGMFARGARRSLARPPPGLATPKRQHRKTRTRGIFRTVLSRPRWEGANEKAGRRIDRGRPPWIVGWIFSIGPSSSTPPGESTDRISFRSFLRL